MGGGGEGKCWARMGGSARTPDPPLHSGSFPTTLSLTFARGEGRSPGTGEGRIGGVQRWRAAGWRVD